jgi:hypothetical protein
VLLTVKLTLFPLLDEATLVEPPSGVTLVWSADRGAGGATESGTNRSGMSRSARSTLTSSGRRG